MTTPINWANGVDGDWNTGTLWSPMGVPTVTNDVTIDAADTLYTVTIASGTTAHAASVTMNGTTGLPGTNDPNAPYHAAQLVLDGTLAFGAGDGSFGGSLQNIIVVDAEDSAEILNGGTINAFIQVSGTLLMTGTNGIYITNELQALAGTVTIDTSSIAEFDKIANTLTDGIFEAKGPGAVVDLGGALEALIVNIATLEGPPSVPGGWTELTFNDPTAEINQWNGTAYVSVESSLNTISGGGTVDVLDGRDYNTAQELTINNAGTTGVAPGMFNLQAGTVTTAGLNINSGVVQGYGTIASGVTNNGTLIALGGAASGTLDVTGTLSGTGLVQFDNNDQTGTTDPTFGTLVLSAVAAGQTITMNSGDTLVLATPAAFHGTIAAAIGGTIVLDGITATSAVLTNGTLVVNDGSVEVASLAVSGSYTGESFTAQGSIISLGTSTVPPPPTPGSVTLSGSASQYIIADDAGSLYIQDTVSDRDGTQILPGVTKMVFTDGVGIFDPTGTAEDVARLYTAALDRQPDATGLQYWTNQVDNGHVPLVDVATAFTASPEFIQDYGTLTNTQFVNQLYENVLDRPADNAGSQYWDAQLASGSSRGAVVLGFSQSTEYITDNLATTGDVNNAEAYRLYTAALGRVPDAPGEAYWSGQLASGVPISSVAQSFVSTPEFQQTYGTLSPSDFVSTLYQNVLHRAGDQGGQTYWTAYLQDGGSEATVVASFSDSIENRAQTAGATHANWVSIPT